jgi:hypothetical protein
MCVEFLWNGFVKWQFRDRKRNERITLNELGVRMAGPGDRAV